MSAKIITIAIEKGGTGKTVTASNLAYLMGDEGKKVLCVDTDPQGNLTKALSGGLSITSDEFYGKALLCAAYECYYSIVSQFCQSFCAF